MSEEIPTFIPLPAFGFLTRLTPSLALRELPLQKGERLENCILI